MLTLSNSTRTILATAAVVATFGPLAAPVQADESAHPLLDRTSLYGPKLSVALGDGERVAGFVVSAFKPALANMGEKPQIVDYPPRAAAEALRITAVVPPKGMENQPIPVCAEQNNKVLRTWNITPKGEVVSVTGSWSTVAATPTSAACKEFILGSRAEINRLAQLRGVAPRVDAAPAPVPGKVSMLP